MKIALTNIYVEDPVGKAYAFYTEKLGFVPKLFVPESELVIVASREDPDGTALLLEPNEHPVAKAYQDALYGLGLPVIILGVDDMAAEHARLVEAGVLFVEEPSRNEQGWEATFDDTCGNYVQLFQLGR